jgi:hypothetical protein
MALITFRSAGLKSGPISRPVLAILHLPLMNQSGHATCSLITPLRPAFAPVARLRARGCGPVARWPVEPCCFTSGDRLRARLDHGRRAPETDIFMPRPGMAGPPALARGFTARVSHNGCEPSIAVFLDRKKFIRDRIENLAAIGKPRMTNEACSRVGDAMN